MMTQALNVNLTAELRRYLKEQVRSGRYQNENEVVRDAIRQMRLREIEQFERVFSDYGGAPRGEPTVKDQATIRAAIHRHRGYRPPVVGEAVWHRDGHAGTVPGLAA